MAKVIRPAFSRRQAFHLLGLDGNGELWPAEVSHRVRVERGSVCVSVHDRARDFLAVR